MAAIKKRGRAGLASALVLSFIALFLACWRPLLIFPPRHSFAVFIYLFVSIHDKKTPVSERAQHQTSGLLFQKCKWLLFVACSCHRVDEGIVGSLVFVFLRAAVGLRSSA